MFHPDAGKDCSGCFLVSRGTKVFVEDKRLHWAYEGEVFAQDCLANNKGQWMG